MQQTQTVSIIGLGFVGLPLACAFVRKGFHVIGIDLSSPKIKMLLSGKSYIHDIKDEELNAAMSSGRLVVSDDYQDVREADSLLICVPTPLTSFHTPDLSYLTDTCNRLVPLLRKGQLVVLESSTYPGTTSEIALPLLEKSGLHAGKDFFLAYSPERIDPGSQVPLEQIPKVISGITANCLSKVEQLYRQLFDEVVSVSSTELAEMSKLLENTFRLVNISFINEFAQICDKMNLNIWEVIAAASTKPYGFTAFYPGPGAGGHCIPVHPYYLQWKADLYGIKSEFIKLSHRINESMPSYTVDRLRYLLEPTKALPESKVLLYGVTYKRDIPDIRESSALALIRLLRMEGVDVVYHDPLIPSLSVDDLLLTSVNVTEDVLKNVDVVLIHTDHSGIPLERILEHAPFVVDSRNVLKGRSGPAKVVTIGGGFV